MSLPVWQVCALSYSAETSWCRTAWWLCWLRCMRCPKFHSAHLRGFLICVPSNNYLCLSIICIDWLKSDLSGCMAYLAGVSVSFSSNYLKGMIEQNKTMLPCSMKYLKWSNTRLISCWTVISLIFHLIRFDWIYKQRSPSPYSYFLILTLLALLTHIKKG